MKASNEQLQEMAKELYEILFVKENNFEASVYITRIETFFSKNAAVQVIGLVAAEAELNDKVFEPTIIL